MLPLIATTSESSGPPQKDTGIDGFTLLEVLVSIAIFAVVISMVLTAMNTLVSISRGRSGGLAPQEAAAACFHRMMMDLQSIYVVQPPLYQPPAEEDRLDPYRMTGTKTDVGLNTFSRMRFASMAHLPLNTDTTVGIGEIVYYVHPEPDDTGYTLRRADRILLADSDRPRTPDPVLCERIGRFNVIYYDDASNEFEEWNSDDERFNYKTPAAVRLEIGIETEGGMVLFDTVIGLPVQRTGREPDTL